MQRLITVCILVFFAFFFDLQGQSIPDYRKTDWSHAGTIAYNNVHNAILNIDNLGAVGDGANAEDSIIQAAIDSMSDVGGGIVFIPAGTYLCSETLTLKSNVVLRGEGSNNTVLRFSLGGSGDCISAVGSAGAESSFQSAAQVGDKKITLASHSLAVNDWIRLYQGDSTFITSSWAEDHVGQIVKVDSISGNEIFFNDPLRIYMSVGQAAKAIKLLPLTNCGVEDMRIVRNDATSGQTSNIVYDRVVESWIYGVESDSCNFAHVELSRCSDITIRGCYMRNAHGYGSGGKAYGVSIQFTTGNSLIEDNIFQQLRHAILFQACPNGNVVAYNYSIDPYWTENFVPSDYPGDIVMHGNYPYFNLVEGNILNNLRIDASHGVNGKHNTFFRNRMTNFGIIMSTSPASDSQTFVANEITGTGSVFVWPLTYNRGQYTLQGSGHFEYGNNQNGTYNPSGSTGNPVNSLFLDAAPAYWVNSGTWPTLGGSNTINTGTNPAQYRYNNNTLKTTPLGMGEALPVELIAFTGERKGRGVLLKWATASEINNKEFVVYKIHEDGYKTELGVVPGNNTLASASFYRYIDPDLPIQTSATYQLQQVDFDGSIASIGYVHMESEQSAMIRVVPNPFKSVFELRLSSPRKENLDYDIIDLTGRVVMRGAMNENQLVDLSDFPNGLYHLTVRKGSVVIFNQRIIKH